MPDCSILAQTQLKKFKVWLESKGHAWRAGNGHHQVIQVLLQGQPRWHVIYYRESNPVHYSVTVPLIPAVQQFIAEKKQHGKVQHSARRAKGGTRDDQAVRATPAKGPESAGEDSGAAD